MQFYRIYITSIFLLAIQYNNFNQHNFNIKKSNRLAYVKRNGTYLERVRRYYVQHECRLLRLFLRERILSGIKKYIPTRLRRTSINRRAQLIRSRRKARRTHHRGSKVRLFLAKDSLCKLTT